MPQTVHLQIVTIAAKFSAGIFDREHTRIHTPVTKFRERAADVCVCVHIVDIRINSVMICCRLGTIATIDRSSRFLYKQKSNFADELNDEEHSERNSTNKRQLHHQLMVEPVIIIICQ